jgi:hypothetical protein
MDHGVRFSRQKTLEQRLTDTHGRFMVATTTQHICTCRSGLGTTAQATHRQISTIRIVPYRVQGRFAVNMSRIRIILATLVAAVGFAVGAAPAMAITAAHCQNALLGQNNDGAVTRDNDINAVINFYNRGGGAVYYTPTWVSSTHPSAAVINWRVRFYNVGGGSFDDRFACNAGGDGIISTDEDGWLGSW